MALVVNKGEGTMAVIEPPSPLFSLNHFTFRDHTHTHTTGMHAHTHAMTDLTWTSGHLVEEFNWPISPFSRSGSLCLSECHRTCQALMPSNLLPNTHCRLSFKGLLTVMSTIPIPPSLPFSSLSFFLHLSLSLSLSLPLSFSHSLMCHLSVT